MNPDSQQNILEHVMKIINDKKRVTPVTRVTNDLTSSNDCNLSVTHEQDSEVTSGLHECDIRDITRIQEGICISGECLKSKSRGGLYCMEANLPVSEIYWTKGRCPEGRWNRRHPCKTNGEPLTDCTICNTKKWWKKKGEYNWICAKCHPPGLQNNLVEWSL